MLYVIVKTWVYCTLYIQEVKFTYISATVQSEQFVVINPGLACSYKFLSSVLCNDI